MGTESPISDAFVAKISMEDPEDKSSKNEVKVDKTAMDEATLKKNKAKMDADAAMLKETKAKIEAKIDAAMPKEITARGLSVLEAFVKELKIRQALKECGRTVLQKFFETLANAEDPADPSSGVIKNPRAGLAKDVLHHMSKDKAITGFNTLEILLETLMEGHSDAVAWKPETGKEQEALMQYITGDCAKFWIGTSGSAKALAPGFWLKLKIRQELCAHILSSDNF
jgi:hypothetical protein